MRILHAMKRQRGLTLPETVAALVGLAIVTLSIVAVHVEKLQSTPGMAMRQQAQDLARELSKIVVDNRDGGVRYENAIGVLCNANMAALKNATPHQLAINDVACWQDKVGAQLPNGVGTISVDETGYPVAYVITVNWSQPGARTASYVVRVANPSLATTITTTRNAPPSAARAVD